MIEILKLKRLDLPKSYFWVVTYMHMDMSNVASFFSLAMEAMS